MSYLEALTTITRDRVRDLTRLPDTRTCFLYPDSVSLYVRSQDTDPFALQYLDLFGAEFFIESPSLVPLVTTGDGDCLLNAVSLALWGVELFAPALRQALADELRSNESFYRPIVIGRLRRIAQVASTAKEEEEASAPRNDQYNQEERLADDKEWQELIQQAETKGSYLGQEHAFALSAVIRRPIIVYASTASMRNFSTGTGSAAAVFVPRRIPSDHCYKRPVLLGWTSSSHRHYVPLVGLKNSSNVSSVVIQQFPSISLAFPPEEDNQKLEDNVKSQYIDWNEPIIEYELISTVNPAIDGTAAGEAEQQRLVDELQRFIGSCQQEQSKRNPALIEAARKNGWHQVNPEDNKVYDMVIPIIMGTWVAYVGCDFTDDGQTVVTRFVTKWKLPKPFMYHIISFLLREKQRAFNGGLPPDLTKVHPSARSISESTQAMFLSLDAFSNLGIPCKKLFLHQEKPTEQAIRLFIDNWNKRVSHLSLLRRLFDPQRVYIAVANTAKIIEGNMNTSTILEQETAFLVGCPILLMSAMWDPPDFSSLNLIRYAMFNPLFLKAFFIDHYFETLLQLLSIHTMPFSAHVGMVRLLANLLGMQLTAYLVLTAYPINKEEECCVPSVNTGLYQVTCSGKADVKAIAVGHDHMNEYQGLSFLHSKSKLLLVMMI